MTNATALLLTAVFRGELEKITSLLEAGGDVNELDEDGRTALQHAVIDGNLTVAEYLVKNNADINHQDSVGYSALHYAAQNSWCEITSLLIEREAILDIKDHYGNTPLWKAVFSYREDISIIKLLVTAGANPEYKNKHGVSPKDLAVTKGDIISEFN